MDKVISHGMAMSLCVLMGGSFESIDS